MRLAVALVSMPWALPEYPCAGLGLLEAVLRRAGLAARTHSLHLAAFDFFGTADLGDAPRDPRTRLAPFYDLEGLGDAVFVRPPRDSAAGPDGDYLTHPAVVAGVDPAALERARRVRALVPAFLTRCATEVLDDEAPVVGFSVTLTAVQLLPSLALARQLKRHRPDLRVVFGGNLDGPAGPALLRAYPFIDAVARGKAEAVAVPLIEDLRAGGPVRPLPGVCSRREETAVATPEDPGAAPPLDELPVPDYDEYFARLAASPLRDYIEPQIPVEGSRGCWWGERSKCRFCGFAADLRFRAKSAGRLVGEMTSLAARHRRLRFALTDAVLGHGAFDDLLPRLRDGGHDFRIQALSRTHLSKTQVRLLSQAGIRSNAAGLESLSSPILKLVRKGATVRQNIRFLKWHEEFGISVYWHFMYGFPGEPVEEYERMAELVGALTHLPPPVQLRPLFLVRFSDYHDHAARHGLEVVGPYPAWRLLYGLDDATLMDLTDSFAYRHRDGRTPEAYVAPLRRAVAAWQQAYPRDRGALRSLRGPGFLELRDGRGRGGGRRFVLDEIEARIYLACDAGRRPARIARDLADAGLTAPSADEIRAFLDTLVTERLMIVDDDRYVSLALPATPEAAP
jgi:ribosomal peptide maturation radical SAM protein 1